MVFKSPAGSQDSSQSRSPVPSLRGPGPLRYALLLVFAVVLTTLAAWHLHAENIESKLMAQAQAVLQDELASAARQHQKDQPIEDFWARLESARHGRDIIIIGDAPSRFALKSLREKLKQIDGMRSVHHRGKVALADDRPPRLVITRAREASPATSDQSDPSSVASFESKQSRKSEDTAFESELLLLEGELSANQREFLLHGLQTHQLNTRVLNKIELASDIRDLGGVASLINLAYRFANIRSLKLEANELTIVLVIDEEMRGVEEAQKLDTLGESKVELASLEELLAPSSYGGASGIEPYVLLSLLKRELDDDITVTLNTVPAE